MSPGPLTRHCARPFDVSPIPPRNSSAMNDSLILLEMIREKKPDNVISKHFRAATRLHCCTSLQLSPFPLRGVGAKRRCFLSATASRGAHRPVLADLQRVTVLRTN